MESYCLISNFIFASLKYYLLGDIETILEYSNIQFLLLFILSRELIMPLLSQYIILFAGLFSAKALTGEALQTVRSRCISMPLEFRIDGVVEARQHAAVGGTHRVNSRQNRG